MRGGVLSFNQPSAWWTWRPLSARALHYQGRASAIVLTPLRSTRRVATVSGFKTIGHVAFIASAVGMLARGVQKLGCTNILKHSRKFYVRGEADSRAVSLDAAGSNAGDNARKLDLEARLQEAVKSEDYQKAAELRDALQEFGPDRETLEGRLAQAVKDEDFSEAARLRDELQLLNIDREAGVLCANNEFYCAFRACDPDRMAALWLRSDRSKCVHPGWRPLEGHDDIVYSWQAIFSRRQSMDIECLRPTVEIRGNIARLVCLERIDEGTEVVAVNQYEITAEGWKMCYHEAGFFDDPHNATAKWEP